MTSCLTSSKPLWSRSWVIFRLHAGKKVVQADDFVPVANEAVAKVGADEPGAARDQNALRLQVRLIGVQILSPYSAPARFESGLPMQI